MPNQTPEQKETIAQLEAGRTQSIERVFEEYLTSGKHMIRQYYMEGFELPFRSTAGVPGNGGGGELEGRGDSRREADAQLAQKLLFSSAR